MRRRQSPQLVRRSLRPSLLVDALFLREFGESFGIPRKAQILLGAKSQKPLSRERVVEQADGAILKVTFKIDEHIAAGNEVPFGKPRVADQTVVGEHDSS